MCCEKFAAFVLWVDGTVEYLQNGQSKSVIVRISNNEFYKISVLNLLGGAIVIAKEQGVKCVSNDCNTKRKERLVV